MNMPTRGLIIYIYIHYLGIQVKRKEGVGVKKVEKGEEEENLEAGEGYTTQTIFCYYLYFGLPSSSFFGMLYLLRLHLLLGVLIATAYGGMFAKVSSSFGLDRVVVVVQERIGLHALARAVEPLAGTDAIVAQRGDQDKDKHR